jgi:hypothetical protein
MVGEKYWVFVREDGETYQAWGYLTEAIAEYVRENGGNMDNVVAIVSH